MRHLRSKALAAVVLSSMLPTGCVVGWVHYPIETASPTEVSRDQQSFETISLSWEVSATPAWYLWGGPGVGVVAGYPPQESGSETDKWFGERLEAAAQETGLFDRADDAKCLLYFVISEDPEELTGWQLAWRISYRIVSFAGIVIPLVEREHFSLNAYVLDGNVADAFSLITESTIAHYEYKADFRRVTSSLLGPLSIAAQPVVRPRIDAVFDGWIAAFLSDLHKDGVLDHPPCGPAQGEHE